MLIPAWLYHAALYGLLGVAFVCLLYFIYRPRLARVRASSDVEHAELPAAKVMMTSRQRVLRVLPGVGLVAGLSGAWALNRVSHDVVIVEDGAGPTGRDAPHVTRHKLLGLPTYELAPTEEKPSDYGDPTWVVNRSQTPVRIETAHYGHMSFGGGTPHAIPTGFAGTASAIDFIGPDDPPPKEIQVDEVEGKMGLSFRYWLTWGPPAPGW